MKYLIKVDRNPDISIHVEDEAGLLRGFPVFGDPPNETLSEDTISWVAEVVREAFRLGYTTARFDDKRGVSGTLETEVVRLK